MAMVSQQTGPPEPNDVSIEPFRRDPLIRFFLRCPLWLVPTVFFLLYATLGICSLRDGTFFKIPQSPVPYPPGALLVPFLKEPFSPVFVFLFYTCLLWYARYLDRRIRHTLNALYERGILNEKAHPREAYFIHFQRLFDSRWAWAFSVFLSIWFLFVWTFARLGHLDGSLGVIIYITARNSYLAFIWILVFSVIGPHLFMSVLWRIMVCSYMLNRTFLTFRDIRLQPLHPDNCCGLRFIGDFTLAMSGFVTFYPLFLAMLSFFYPRFVNNLVTEIILIYSGAIFYIIIASIVFIFPTYSAHNLMMEERESAIQVLNIRFFRLYEDVFGNIENRDINEELLENQIKLLNNIREFYKEVSNPAIWPFNLKVVSQFMGIIGVPLLLMFLQRFFK